MLKLKTYDNQIKLVYKIKVDVFQPFFYARCFMAKIKIIVLV